MKRIVVLIIFILVFGGGFLLYYREGLLPVDKNDASYKILVIPKGESLINITNDLAGAGLIRSKVAFFILVKRLGIDKDIQYGDFRLSPSEDALTIAQALTHGTLDTWITIVEGLRKEEIAQLITKEFNIPEAEFLKYAKEGYLFPDTYLIPKNATASAIIKILTDNFNKKYNQTLQKKAATLGLTSDQIIVLASLVEREAKFDNERAGVASVLLKRFNSNLPLQVDSTIQYALGYQPLTNTWWKTPLTQADLQVASPYNTYIHIGLPPGPIDSPGLASIKAVLNADPNTPYLFYVSDSQGHLHFARTLDGHNVNIQKYVK